MVRQSDSIAKLAAALVKAQAEVQHAAKDSKNPHFKSGYASLESVLDTLKPVLASHGLAVVQIPGFEGGICTLDTVLVHESGEWMAATSGAPVSKQDPQGVGSAITYLRRYSLVSLAGIAQADDDGNAASGKDETEGLIAEVKALLKRPTADAARKAALDAIDTRDTGRLRAAIAYLKDQQKGAA